MLPRLADPGISTLDLFRLDDRTAWISGAAGHLGAQITRALHEAGAHVVLTGRDRAALEQLHGDLGEARATIISLDVTDRSQLADAFARIKRERRSLEVLVNNAYSGPPGDVKSATQTQFEDAYRIGVIAPFEATRMALPVLAQAVERGAGASVINVGSMYGSVSPDPAMYPSTRLHNPPYYGAAKAALRQITRYLACHLAPRGIRVNSLTPGPFPSPDTRSENPDFCASLARRAPAGRVGEASEIRGPILFLASRASSYMTGADITADGGWTAW